MKRQLFKISSAISSHIMMAVIFLVLGVSLAGCGKEGTTDEPDATAESDAFITGLVGTPSDYSKEDN